MPTLDLTDIQGIIVRGYGSLRGARFVLLGIRDAAAARRWLGALDIRSGESRPNESDTCVNVAFTHAGLEKLGVYPDALAMFAGEFREGMTESEHRRRILGDLEESAPEHWRWGGPRTAGVDALLMLYASEDRIEAVYQAHAARFASAGLDVVAALPTIYLPGRKEHFGFRDGIAQPLIEGLDKPGPPENTVAAGEFLLGYANAYGQYTERPLLARERDPRGLLPEPEDGSSLCDLGKNGSYLVLRTLSQDVFKFWSALDDRTRTGSGAPDPAARDGLAAKMVGRWPSGASLVKSPEADNPQMMDDDDFLYYGSGDPHGLKCPLGSHVRRSNPRDSLDPTPGSAESIDVGKRHRLIRRGRAYGPPIAQSMESGDILAAGDDGQERGLHFICFNTHIGRQFEFIQHTWVNSPKFDGLYADDDPLVGDRGAGGKGEGGTFVVQATPVRKRVVALPRFVHTRGGAYFFMPGLRAARFLASLPSRRS
jgi:Dyp-type peroxidase family